MPKGDPTKGKTVFEKYECYYCHEVRGEQFPSATEDAPELSQMGAMHPVEFFAESIMNPDAVVPKAYRGSESMMVSNRAPRKNQMGMRAIDASECAICPDEKY